MKYKYLLILFTLFISCKEKIKEQKVTQKFNEIKEIELKLPKLKKWNDCKDYPAVKIGLKEHRLTV